MSFEVLDFQGNPRIIEGDDPVARRVALVNELLNAEAQLAVVPGISSGQIDLPNAATSIAAILAFETSDGDPASPCLLVQDEPGGGSDDYELHDGGVQINSDQSANNLLIFYRAVRPEWDARRIPYAQD